MGGIAKNAVRLLTMIGLPHLDLQRQALMA